MTRDQAFYTIDLVWYPCDRAHAHTHPTGVGPSGPPAEAPAPDGEIEIIPAEPDPRSGWSNSHTITDDYNDAHTISAGVLRVSHSAYVRDALALLDRAGLNATAIDVRDRARKEIAALRAELKTSRAAYGEACEARDVWIRRAQAAAEVNEHGRLINERNTLSAELTRTRTDRDSWRTACVKATNDRDRFRAHLIMRNAEIAKLREQIAQLHDYREDFVRLQDAYATTQDERDRARHEVKSLQSKYGVGGAGGEVALANLFKADPDARKNFEVLYNRLAARAAVPAKPVPCTRDEADRDRAKSEWRVHNESWSPCSDLAASCILSPRHAYRTTAPLDEHVEVSHTTAERLHKAGVMLENQWDFGARAWVRSPSWKGGDSGARYRVLRAEVPEGFVLG